MIRYLTASTVGFEQHAHVLLTACSPGETAQKVNIGGNCGLFTQTLLAQLKYNGKSKGDELTYQKAIDNVTIILWVNIPPYSSEVDAALDQLKISGVPDKLRSAWGHSRTD